MDDNFWFLSSLMRTKGHLQTVEVVKDLVCSISLLCRGGSNSGESSGGLSIVERVKYFVRMIPRDNKNKSLDHLDIFELLGAPSALVSLLDSSIEGHKQIGDDSIRLFLHPNIDFLPKRVQNQFVSVVLGFCKLLRGRVNDEPLYYSCRETLGSLLNSISDFAKMMSYFDTAEASHLIKEFSPFVYELSDKLRRGLVLIKDGALITLSTCFRLSFERDIHEFAVFSFHLRRAIEDHFRSKDQSLPLCVDFQKFDEHLPCYLAQIQSFYHVYFGLQTTMYLCMGDMNRCIEKKTEGVWEFNHAWFYYLSVLKELINISKLYQGAEEKISSIMLWYQLSLNVLVRYSKWGDDQWLLKQKNLLDFESRRHLMRLMFPEVKDDHEKLHKMHIDRTQLLAESFEHFAHAKPKLLRNGLFLEFKNEVATGHGVLREWLFLVCQALFSPENSFFLACPSDRRRFFPNPAATMNPQHLDYFAFYGRVIAFALMHKVQIGISFDRIFFLQLAGEVISLEDVRYADACIEAAKRFLKSMRILWEIEEFGSRKVVDLCPGGNTISVNSKNREEYVQLLIQQCYVRPTSEKVASFARGFGDILCKRRFRKIFFQSFDLEDLDSMLVGSGKAICVKDWKAHTDYDDYKETDEQICWFWKVVADMSLEQQRELLFFWTSVKYLPVNGFSGLPSRLYIYKTPGSHSRLPSSLTCFYRLSLPHYPSLDVMQQHLFLICQEHVGCGFGFS